MNHTPLVLVVEDEKDIRSLIVAALRNEGWETEEAATGETALAAIKNRVPDLVVLDLMLPGMHGLAVCRKMRQAAATRSTPVIIVTACGDENDAVEGLDAGADDYVVKPFSPSVLVARIRSALRRSGRLSDSQSGFLEDGSRAYGSLIINPAMFETAVDGEKVDLTATEFKILLALTRRPGMVFTRSRILEELYGRMKAVTDRAIDVHMTSLRRKLGKAGNLIETIRGVGYRFLHD